MLRPDDARPGTVLCHGVFDLLHLGHIRHLKEARSLGDRLVVSITADRHVEQRKGKGRPQFSVEQRREALKALDCVDEVVVSESGTAAEVIAKIRPAVYVKGPDYVGAHDPGLLSEIAAVEAVGGRFHITTSEKWSSTQLLRNVRLPDATLAYVEDGRERGFLGEILGAFERADKLKIVFVGETIIDEYRYVKPLAKPSKEFILATVADREEKFEGGVLAAARHCDWADASIVTSGAAITKTRFVDGDFSRKLFEVYSAREIELGCLDLDLLRDEVAASDVCVAMDFGHGLFGNVERNIVMSAGFLAVTAQSNAGNYGFNQVTKFHRADYVCVDEPEARLAVGHQGGSVEDVASRILAHTKAKAVTVTRGRYGSATVAKGIGLKQVPAFVESGFDTMGAGDAFLAVAGPLVAAGLAPELAAFAGNVAGGLKTTILGHSRHVGRDDIVKNLEWLLR